MNVSSDNNYKEKSHYTDEEIKEKMRYYDDYIMKGNKKSRWGLKQQIRVYVLLILLILTIFANKPSDFIMFLPTIAIILDGAYAIFKKEKQ